MKKIVFIVYLLLFQMVVFAGERIKYNFNPSWKLYMGDVAGAESVSFDDSSWKKIALPHAWNEDDAFLKAIHEHSTGIVWYRKKFKIPAENKDQKVFLEFEGIRFGGEFYLNGKPIGRHENGVMAFGFDISDDLNFGEKENVIAVRIDNAWNYREKETNSTYQWNDKNFNANYGGIPKNVWLHILPKIYQTLPLYSNLKTVGTYIYANQFDIDKRLATLNVDAPVKNETSGARVLQLQVEVKDLSGKTVKEFVSDKVNIKSGETVHIKASERLENLNFWSWGYAYLYTVNTKILQGQKVIDNLETKIGIRKTEFKNGMVYLNDKVLMMKGYAQRTSNEWPAIGMSTSPWLSDFSNKLMVQSNANLVRWMHVTPWKQDVESCDRVGLIQAMQAGDAEKDVEGRRWEQRVELMRDAIIYNRNSPSIFFYECGNESISEAHMIEMKKVRDTYDPYGARAIGSREMLDSKNSEYGGEMLYINKSAGQPMWSMEYSRDEGLRKYWDEFTPPFHKNGAGPLYKGQDASDYNRNQDTHAIEDVIRWAEYWDQRPGTGKRVSSGGVNIIFSDSNTHFRGEENYRRSGEVDAMRIPKDGFYAHQVMWDGWVDPKNTGLHIIGHWNYAKGTVKDEYVVSTGDKVELFLNGKSLGFGEQSYHFLFTFKNVRFEAGELKAVSYNGKGEKLAEKILRTAGEPASIKLTKMGNPNGLKANGNDMVLIQFEVVDAKGNRCPTALNMVDFNVEGDIDWRGGIAQGPNNYILAKSLPVECGLNRVLMRTFEGKTGTVKITATSKGLKSASVTLTVDPVIIKNGLTLYSESAKLPVNLDRGPTPKENTVKVVREALDIVSVKAGANQETAKNSYDDNELSDWVNDGKLATAWISYVLKEEAPVSEVVMKLNNFRSKIYPLKIYVDNRLVFNGNSKKSLGYFTATFPPTKGKTVKIELGGSAKTEGKDYGAEVGGKKLDDGVTRDDVNTKGSLSLIEVEIYKKAI
ncbi:glycoside hydrolase family 2 sugar binding protein [Pseudopedobacter saltans DSM 12145]|uniref:Glycoside hydrolase family 2 sugar binding protein n=1 Tax=Pseudopedobacter saltans (strain ATCC 51119 / DSM 12145 / JCM 21818 / CCUG 39354 / LMG 10337 / NBRC 100064 / NCIMB 13643) TaxID=762903 RepID=F0S6E1_PSESL|nr:DUF4982 domain-containing protein [Pseudopedobacter saltans]ADY54267.1 glycoside hydrolase family 2 sugar binding protein [Pseudopedobacter saltans DSM 12145]